MASTLLVALVVLPPHLDEPTTATPFAYATQQLPTTTLKPQLKLQLGILHLNFLSRTVADITPDAFSF